MKLSDEILTVIQRQIDATDRQIDRLLYELYELTEEEIVIVENPNKLSSCHKQANYVKIFKQ